MFREYVRKRLTERSTWAGLVTLAIALSGLNLTVEQQAWVATLGSTLAAGILIFTQEKPKNVSPDDAARRFDGN